VTGIYAARVAARIRRELKTDVEMVKDRYGKFRIAVDGQTVIDGGTAAFLGVMPSSAKILTAVRDGLKREPALSSGAGGRVPAGV
jgi:hypothetical protein